jgi:hypothetical protein
VTLVDSDHTDIGTLVGWALRPAQRPGRNPEYQRVLSRYRTELPFKTATNAVLHGLGAGARSVVTSAGTVPARSAQVKNRRAAVRSRRSDSSTSMTWPCWPIAR